MSKPRASAIRIRGHDGKIIPGRVCIVAWGLAPLQYQQTMHEDTARDEYNLDLEIVSIEE